MTKPFIQYMVMEGGWWFRVWGYGITVEDHGVYPPLFSERYGYRRGLHVGSWCFKLLRGSEHN